MSNEIEVLGTSIGFKVFRCLGLETEGKRHAFIEDAMAGEHRFMLEEEQPGFHDLDADGDCLSGAFSAVIAFEIEHLSNRIQTTSLLKRIDTAYFLVVENTLFFYGNAGAAKSAICQLGDIVGATPAQLVFESDQLRQFSERASAVRSVSLSNPKSREIQKAKLTSQDIENYEEYNVIDPANHSLDAVCGLIESPAGPIFVTAGRRGLLRLKVKKGLILPADCLLWVLHVVQGRDVKVGVNLTLFNVKR